MIHTAESPCRYCGRSDLFAESRPESPPRITAEALDALLPELPRPSCTYADHSYPAFSKAQMLEFAKQAIEANRRPEPPRITADVEQAIAIKVGQIIADLPDRTSPEDWPEALLVTADEIEWIVPRAIRDAIAAQSPEQAGAEAEKGNFIELNFHQAQNLLAFFGGADADVTVQWFDSCKCSESGEDMPEGLYAYCTEYPEEGRVFLDSDNAPQPPAWPIKYDAATFTLLWNRCILPVIQNADDLLKIVTLFREAVGDNGVNPPLQAGAPPTSRPIGYIHQSTLQKLSADGDESGATGSISSDRRRYDDVALYAAPPQPTGLSEKEKRAVAVSALYDESDGSGWDDQAGKPTYFHRDICEWFIRGWMARARLGKEANRNG